MNKNYIIFLIFSFITLFTNFILINNNIKGGLRNDKNFKPLLSKGLKLNIKENMNNSKLKLINNKKNIIITVPHKCLDIPIEKDRHVCDLLSEETSKYINNYLLNKNFNVTHIFSKQNRLQSDDNRYNSLKNTTPLWKECIKKIKEEKINLHLDIHSFNKKADKIFDNILYKKKIILLLNSNSLLFPLIYKNLNLLNKNGIYLHAFNKNYDYIIALHDFFNKNYINSILLEFNEEYTLNELKPIIHFFINFLIKKLKL